MTQQAGDWMWWRAALAGHRQAVVQGEPQVGYWRRKFKATKTRPGSDEAVAIWKDAAGAWQCLIGKTQRITDVDRIYEIFESCCKAPVTYEHYRHWTEHSVWPTDLPAAAMDPEPAAPAAAEPERGIGDNSEANGGPSTHELAVDAVANAQKAYRDWRKTIGNAITTQDEADLAGNYRDRFTKLRTRADECRAEEKEPHLRAGREVDDKWRSVIADADEMKREVLRDIELFLKAEKARLQREREEALAKAAEERKAAAEAAAAGQPAPEVAPAPAVDPGPVTVRAGTTGRRTGLRKVQCVRIVDIEKVKQAFIQTPAGEFAAKEWAEKTGAQAPIPIPGTEQFTDEVAR